MRLFGSPKGHGVGIKASDGDLTRRPCVTLTLIAPILIAPILYTVPCHCPSDPNPNRAYLVHGAVPLPLRATHKDVFRLDIAMDDVGLVQRLFRKKKNRDFSVTEGRGGQGMPGALWEQRWALASSPSNNCAAIKRDSLSSKGGLPCRVFGLSVGFRIGLG